MRNAQNVFKNLFPKARSDPSDKIGGHIGWDGETAKAYGVQFIPKSYAVDRERTILQKDLNPDELEEYLLSRFNGTSSSN